MKSALLTKLTESAQSRCSVVKLAIMQIAMSLPSENGKKKTSIKAVIAEAMAFISYFWYRPEYKDAKGQIMAFVQASPKGPGIERKKEWWNILLAHFPPEHVVEIYVCQQQQFLYPYQHANMVRYLGNCEQVPVNQGIVNHVLEEFNQRRLIGIKITEAAD